MAMVSESLSAGGLFFDLQSWFWAASAVLAVSVLWWLPFVRGITRSVSQMTFATERIAEGRFNTRVPEDRGDELGRLRVAEIRPGEVVMIVTEFGSERQEILRQRQTQERTP